MSSLRDFSLVRCARRAVDERQTRRKKRANHYGLETPGGARSSLARGYYHVVPPGLQFFSLRPHGRGQTPLPYPRCFRSPERKKRANHFALVTPGGARSSLARGYYHVVPPGLQFGSLRSHGGGQL